MIRERKKFGAMLLAACLFGCGDDAPTGSTALILESISTATDREPDAVRVQVSLNVTSGLDAFTTAVSAGGAATQVCVQETCVSGAIALGVIAPTCTAGLTSAAGNAQFGFAGSWLDGDAVEIDFCVADLTDPTVFELTVTDGVNVSNVTRTSCAPAGQGLVCASD